MNILLFITNGITRVFKWIILYDFVIWSITRIVTFIFKIWSGKGANWCYRNMTRLNHENIIKIAYPGISIELKTVFLTTNFIFGPGILIEFKNFGKMMTFIRYGTRSTHRIIRWVARATLARVDGITARNLGTWYLVLNTAHSGKINFNYFHVLY